MLSALAKELFNASIGDDKLLHSLNQQQSIPGGVAPPRFDPSTRPPHQHRRTGPAGGEESAVGFGQTADQTRIGRRGVNRVDVGRAGAVFIAVVVLTALLVLHRKSRTMRIAQDKLDAIMARLCTAFPKSFFVHEGRRRPLKLGIHRDILAALGAEIDPKELSVALRVYTAAVHYLGMQRTGAWRIDLHGNVAGTVTKEEAAIAQQRLAGIRKRKPKPARVEPKAEKPLQVEVEPPKPRRLGLADLKAAAMKRKAQAG
jgi:sRNA-binding protein